LLVQPSSGTHNTQPATSRPRKNTTRATRTARRLKVKPWARLRWKSPLAPDKSKSTIACASKCSALPIPEDEGLYDSNTKEPILRCLSPKPTWDTATSHCQNETRPGTKPKKSTWKRSHNRPRGGRSAQLLAVCLRRLGVDLLLRRHISAVSVLVEAPAATPSRPQPPPQSDVSQRSCQRSTPGRTLTLHLR
jgi:hypothetical protein